jgi:hypothetical protein
LTGRERVILLRKLLAGLLREPLLHFVVIGACIYLAYGFYGQQETDETLDRTVTITAGEIAWLTESWEKKWNRAPTPEERQGLIKQYTREIVLYREALAMGLDKDDTVIRRRMVQKLEFLSQDLIQLQPPTEEQLRAFFESHIDRYRAPDLLTMTQIFLDPDKRGDETLKDAEVTKAELEALGDFTVIDRDLGDPFMLQTYYPERSEAELAKLFGSGFADSVFGLEPERWHGPVLSGYGVHLVYVHLRQAAPPPAFLAAEEAVRQDWEDERRAELNKQFIDGVLARYEVTIEDEMPGGAASLAEGQSQ